LLALGSAFCEGSLRADPLSSTSDRAILFLDPGHGGRDTGGRGAAGLLEKDVALALGKHLNNLLAKNHTPRLSRNDDYNVELFRRTETANSQGANLFIGLHTGGAFSHNTGGIAIYYYHDFPGRILPDEPKEGLTFNQAMVRVSWHSVQYRHSAESRMLAEFLQASLAPLAGNVNCRIAGAPLLVLSAADMPAVLIEIGCLNNSAEEKKLSDPNYLDSLAEAIGDGLDNYLGRPPGITSIDLNE
jgi:N-acetylmuramoyl-L-alanine amidase